MRLLPTLVLALPILSFALTSTTHEAHACGGCAVQQGESTQVTGHRMILSVSQTQTTLWDQITYSGNPSDFAWILPIKGQVDIELSSDALFETLDQITQVQILSPLIQCTPPPVCGDEDFAGGSAGAGGAGGGEGVVVIAQEVVGPYETVQLSASDPAALKNWLSANNYNIPAEAQGVVDGYQAEGFDFLALKLVPGQGVSSMRPVRVTSQGATPILPLRMVAVGTGAITPISLWVFGEGRYEPGNFPWFTIKAEDLTWNWDTSSSDYKTVRQAAFDKEKGHAWHVESAEPFSLWYLDQLRWLAESSPKESGYADPNGEGAVEACEADLAALTTGISEQTLWVSKLHADLPRSALANDLEVGASADQSLVSRVLETSKSVGTPPACPVFDPCPDASETNTWDGFWEENSAAGGSGGCAMGGNTGIPATMGLLGLAAAVTLVRRRRR
ncbi:MAG TPA: DUF2330 domain-containing protein [Polyangiaceae bacterium]|jgi:hypothetical protein|nr:DUF2330 domain-containing protein [Polyangiaceae bacterium]